MSKERRPPKESETKEVVISLAVSVDKKATQEEIANTVEGALTGLAERVHNVSNVQVRTVPRVLLRPGDTSGGYESRLWEKVTCDIFGGRLQSPDPDPTITEELERVSAQVKVLEDQVQRLRQAGPQG